jgi:hypothetical protein
MGEVRNACRSLVGRPGWKRSLGRPRHRFEYDIKMGLSEIMLEGVDCIRVPRNIMMI